LAELFIAPAPTPPPAPTSNRTTLLGYARYFSTMQRNPLEIWSDAAYRMAVIPSRFLGRDWLFVHEPDAIRQVFVTNAARYGLPQLRKAFLRPVLGEGLFLAEGGFWRSTRKALTPMFTPRYVAGFEDVMAAIAAERATTWAKAPTLRDISHEMLTLTLDILMACLFSGDEAIDRTAFSETLETLLQENGLPHALDLLGAPEGLPRPGRKKGAELAGRLRAQMRVLIRARRKSLSDGKTLPPDFLTLLLEANDDAGRPLSDTAIVDNLLTFFAAGHETTARSLAWALYLMAMAGDVQTRLRTEICSTSGTDPLPFTDAVIKETLRLYPAAAQISRVALEADEVLGVSVAPGTEVFTSLWVLHRHEAHWQNPGAFNPERFMGNQAEAIHRFQYLPFGLGPRICIGAHFAMMEMRIVLRVLLSRLAFSYEAASPPEPIMRVTVQPREPIVLAVRAV
jgi:cytochrome P450